MSEHEFGDDVPEGQQTQGRMDELFRALIENALDVITIIDAEGVIHYQTSSIERMLGYKPAELIGVNIFELLHPDDVPNVKVAIKVIAPPNGTPGVAQVVEVHLRHKDGSWRILEAIGKALPSGMPVTGIVFNSRDITERKRVEVELRESEEKHRQLFETMIQGVVYQAADGKIISANPSAERFLGLTLDQMQGRTSTDPRWKAIHEDGSDFPGNTHPSMVALATGKGVCDVVMGIFNPEKEDYRWININAVPHFMPGEAVPYQVYTTFEDITERKRAEEETKNLAKFPAENPNPVLRLSRDGLVMYANVNSDALLSMWGCAVGGSAPQFWRDLVAQGLVSRENETVEVDCDGKVYSIFVTPVAESGYVNLYGRDITEHKQMEKRIQAQLQRLAALRAIDTAIVGSIDLRLTLNVVVQQTVVQLGVDAVAVLLLNPNTQTLTYAAGSGFRGKAIERSRLRLGEGYAGRAALERHTISIHNVRETATDFTRKDVLAGEDFVCYHAAPLIAKGQVQGVLEIFARSHRDTDEDWIEFFEMLTQQTAIALDNAQLFDNLQRSIVDLSLAYNATIEGWSRALDLRDKETEGHSLRVTELTERLALAMGIGDEELVNIRRGALLHDIGKMGVQDEILLKPGKLTDEEWVLMRKHPQLAFELLSPIAYLKAALDIPYCHHEKWDGTGYPRGLKGEQIPLVARIFAVVDVWDALLSDRPYRKAWTKEKALEYIKTESGTHFDPQVVDTFLRLHVGL